MSSPTVVLGLPTFDESGNGTGWIEQSWNLISWDTTGRAVFTRDNSGNPTTLTQQIWNGTEWVHESRILWMYEATARTGIADVGGLTDYPEGVGLQQNYPNPYNGSTTIAYQLPEATTVKLVVFDATGRTVAELTNGFLPAGRHSVKWSAPNLASGMYFYRLQAGDFVQTKSMYLAK